MKEFMGSRAMGALIRLLRPALAGKQNVLNGTEDQVVGFNSAGQAVSIDRSVLKGDKGDPGGIYYPTLSINPSTGTLDMQLPTDYQGAVFSINEGKLQMTME
ncbi:MAG: hypothetical protein NC548_13260 [Lachnospiraceae bacterium]|nr:hypothetical protein [Lachnospiraceae bacterium]MCM1230641.1 hypothetical protein [Ruminococcus flavefaciens]